jgi:hypothetical protein
MRAAFRVRSTFQAEVAMDLDKQTIITELVAEAEKLDRGANDYALFDISPGGPCPIPCKTCSPPLPPWPATSTIPTPAVRLLSCQIKGGPTAARSRLGSPTPAACRPC